MQPKTYIRAVGVQDSKLWPAERRSKTLPLAPTSYIIEECIVTKLNYTFIQTSKCLRKCTVLYHKEENVFCIESFIQIVTTYKETLK
jgi:hypothetical protein